MKHKEIIAELRYIADSPSQEFGGFHPYTIEIAKAALKRIAQLEDALIRHGRAAREETGKRL